MGCVRRVVSAFGKNCFVATEQAGGVFGEVVEVAGFGLEAVFVLEEAADDAGEAEDAA